MKAQKKRKWLLFMVMLMLVSTFSNNLALKGSADGAVSTDPSVWKTYLDAFRWKTGLEAEGITPWNGTEEAPTETVTLQNNGGQDVTAYRVYSAEQLQYALARQWSIQLMKDIDLNGQSYNWGSKTISAAGLVIDGNGHTIYNMSNNGGYGFLYQGTNLLVENLSLKNCRTDNSQHYSGLLIGAFVSGRIQNCSVEDSIISGTNINSGFVCGADSQGIKAYDKFIDHCFTRNVNMTSPQCSSMFAECVWNAYITNCYSIDGTIIVSGGHSGGFTSCSRNSYYENCYTNVEVYGNTSTGVFCGIAHQGQHTFKNCYASGKIEGTNMIGGFIAGTDSGTVTIENCYSTSMVGMMGGGVNMGGFAGAGANIQFTNCYAAGEVGTLKSAEDGTPLDNNGNKLTGQNVTGFCGNNAGNFVNCYYDKQTTGMCDYGETTGVKGLLTKELIAKAGELGEAWIQSAGGYPELKVLADSTKAEDRAYSTASVSTVLLYAGEDGTDYDTVRKIRYVFPLTNNTNSGKDQFSISWNNYEAGGRYPNVSPILEGNVPIVTLSDTGRADNVSSVAPGIGWLQVNAQETGSEVVGMRRLRLVPTTAIATVSFGEASLDSMDVVCSQTRPEEVPEGAKDLEGTQMRYDHRDTITFVTTSATKLNSFIADETGGSLDDKLAKWDIKTQQFPKDSETEISEEGVLRYLLSTELNHDMLEAVLQKETEDGTYESVPWTADIQDLFEGKRDAKAEERGNYRISYEWKDTTGTVVKAQGSKAVTIVEPAYVVYHYNYEREDGADIYLTDPGYYPVGMPIGDKIPEYLQREGYTAQGWATDPGAGVTRGVSSEFTAESILHGGQNDVYAVWKANENLLRVEGPQGEEIVKERPVAYDTNIMELLEELGAQNKLPEGETPFLGWSTDPEKGVNIDENSKMPDEDIAIYPVWAVKPVVKTEVENVTHPDRENKVGDILHYTVTVSNEGPNSIWQDVDIRNQLPPGVSFIEGSVKITKPDGSQEGVNDEEIYDEKEHKLTYELGNIPGESTYVLEFEAVINKKAADVSETPEGEENRDISNVTDVGGKDSDGTPIGKKPGEEEGGSISSDPVSPNPGKDGEPGKVTPNDPDGYIRIEVKKDREEEEVRVNEELEYTIHVGNKAPASKWSEVEIENKLPEGMSYEKGSAYIVYPDGREEKIADKDIYDEESHTVRYEIKAIGGEEEYKIRFRTKVNETAVTGPEEEKKDIGIKGTATGKAPHGEEEKAETENKIYPTGDKKNVLWDIPEEKLIKTAFNQSTAKETKVGDRIEYALTAKNEKQGSVWKDVVIYDRIPDGLKLEEGSLELIKADGTRIEADKTVYNAEKKTISIYVGDIGGGESVTVRFTVKVEKEAVGKDIGNIGYVCGEEDHAGRSWLGEKKYEIGSAYEEKEPGTSTEVWMKTQKVYPDTGMEAVTVAGPDTGEGNWQGYWMVLVLSAAAGFLALKRKERFS